jgi:argininosuccinate synthase
MAFFDYTQQYVCGEITLKLYKGNMFLAKSVSKNSLYNEQLASMDVIGDFTPEDTAGYQKIKSIRILN